MHAQDVLTFWFDKLTPKQHFAKDAALAFAHDPQELAFLREQGSSF